jgi:hypothetical protein
MPSGQNGFCETGAGAQDARCFEHEDGGYECHCPNVAGPVMRAEQDCEAALVRACSADCDNEAGHCTVHDIVSMSASATSALAAWFRHRFANKRCARGASRRARMSAASATGSRMVPSQTFDSKGTTVVCRCEGDEDLHVSTVNNGSTADAGAPPNLIVPDQECKTRLARYCGT